MALFALPDRIDPRTAPTADAVQGIIDNLRLLRSGIAPITFGLSAQTTSSSSYVNVTGTIDTFTKVGSATESDLIVVLAISCFVSVASTKVAFGVNIGSNVDVTAMLINPANKHTQLAGIARLTGVAAGGSNTQVQVKRVSGTGIVSFDTSDSYTKLVAEVPLL